MAIQLQGNTGTVAEVSGPTFRALRVETMPIDYGTLGSYSLSVNNGATAVTAAAFSLGEVLQFRWTDSTRLCLVRSVTCDGLINVTTGFTAGRGLMDMIVARSWSAAGTGGATANLTANNQKLRTSMGGMLVGEVRCITTAALGAGTKVLDTQAIGQAQFFVPATAGIQVLNPTPLFDAEERGSMPLVLAQNEGFAVRVTLPATGTWHVGFTVRWTEVTAY